MPDLPPDLQQLLRSARRAAEPSPQQCDRTLNRLEASLRAGATPEVEPEPFEPTTPRVGKAATAKTVSTVAGVALVAVAVAAWPRTQETSEAPKAAATRRTAEPTTVVPTPEVAPQPEPAPTIPVPAPAADSRQPTPPPSPRPTQVAEDTLAEESRLLAQASAALARDDASRALQLVAEHRRRFRRGQLRGEREAVEVLALCALGRYEEGSRARDRFLARFAGSPHTSRVREACSETTKTEPTP